ncbi:sulfatase [Jiangella asiatica]|uniref:Sulfatase N-terminal domain-containing protein n=1 Tax=Jiangella asiatica TaxID=2530372 RepID=A0A4V2Z098_9ACTN|nr:sulfatase-like hydrolase/transferase [Jiangella asiatica]TDE00198.1 hypothetical protein E1269_26150 [Jiangella asiatica]
MSARQPAILFITADELRKDALGCYGNTAVPTPSLDRLAASGTIFDRAYTASPWCLPSRCSIVTGRYPRNHGAYSNFRDHVLSPEIPNLYTVLGRDGYTTAHIGKCHYAPVPYGDTAPDRTLPYQEFRDYYLSLGMDHLALQDDKQVSVWFYDDYTRDLEAAGHLEAYRAAVWDRGADKVFTFPGPAEWHPDAWVGRKSCEWIESYDGGQPPFCWVSFSGPHFPFDPPEAYLARVDDQQLGEPHLRPEEWSEPGRLHYRSFHSRGRAEGGGYRDRDADYWHRLRRNYQANVALIDDQIGLLISAAEKRFGANLVIVFTCDHGEMLGNHGFWGKDCGFYEDVLNVPLLLRRADGVGAGTRSDRLTSLVDVFPTLLATAGVEPVGVDGRHLDDSGHAHVVAEGEGFLTVTDGRHKLVMAHRDDTRYTEMYDVEVDPHEFNSVAGRPEYADAQHELQAAGLTNMINTVLP